MIRVSVAYGLTKPGDVPYSSQNYKIAIDIEDDITHEAAQELVAKLAQDVKIAVINEAGLSAGTDANGVVFPVFAPNAPAPAVDTSVATVTDITSAPSAVPADEVPFDQMPAGGVPEIQTAAPAAPVQSSTKQAPGIDLKWDGRSVRAYDNRPKKASGEHKPNAADFRLKFLDVGDEAPDDVKYKSVWIKNQNGSVNQAGVALANTFDQQAG